jgi:crotonobetainyl-CoA:carnitine CoA-transferase CaiB-like acyl-CoA transferase
MHHVVPRFPGTPGSIRTPAPQLGEHNRAILAELGIDDDAYAKLLASGVVCEGRDAPAPHADKRNDGAG